MDTIFLLLSMWSFPSLREWLWDKITIDSLKVWLNSKALPLLLLSAIASGFATSVRPLGFLAFMLIGGILLFEFKSRSLFPLTLGIGILSLTCILSWPAIWEAPFSRFHESLALASNHPWRGEVLYRGDLYVGGTLPWHYLPTMLLSQLTEPVYILILFGVFVAIREWRDESARELALVAIWFLVPILAAIISGAVLFDNFRQFLFVIPAVFVFVAVGIDRILEKLRYPAVNIPLMLLFVLPVFNAIQKLHPYQYSYYNAGVGGIRGAYRHYELDYWCTSYLDAFEYINQQLSENVTLDVWGADRTAEYYARADIKVVKIDEEILMEYDDTSFVLLPTRRNIDWSIPDQNTELESVELLGIPLAKIYAP